MVIKAKEVWNLKSDISIMNMRELRAIIMPFQNEDGTGVKNRKNGLLVQWNT